MPNRGEETTIFAYFKYLEAELVKLSGAALNRKAADEAKSMLQDLGSDLTKKHDEKV